MKYKKEKYAKRGGQKTKRERKHRTEEKPVRSSTSTVKGPAASRRGIECARGTRRSCAGRAARHSTFTPSSLGRSGREDSSISSSLDGVIRRKVAEDAQEPGNRRSKKYPSQHEVDGTIRITSKGVGYVSVEGMKEDIEIDPAFLGTALDGDRVRILLHPKQNGEREGGEVTSILLRSKTKWVGVLEKDGGRWYVIPDDPRMYRDLFVPADRLAGAHRGDKVFAALRSWTDPKKDPIGAIVRVIGRSGDHDVEMTSIVLERGFDTTFSRDVLDAAEKVPATIGMRDVAKRHDMREIPTFTIDPVDAKDFDDALSFRALPGGTIEVGIHIADVSHYVAPGTPLDKEALERGTSIYLVDRTIPMLPERLSNGICSLVPREDRLAFSAIFTLDRKGSVKNEWFGRTIIHSAHRYSYESAQDAIDHGTGRLADALRSLNAVAKELRRARMAAGAIAFETDEVKFELDRTGTPIRVYRKTFFDTNRMIEEFMLLANKRVAEFIARNDRRAGSVFVYRVHDDPNEDRIRDLRDFLSGIGYELRASKGGKVHGAEINRMLAEVRGRAEEEMIQMATVRAMAKAAYATENIGHYGLAFDYYTHFTSPIRRYPDIMVHRLLANYLDGKPVPKKALEREEHLARYCSQMEVAAAETERASIRAMQIKYWEARIGSTWDGIISGVTEWGIYVEDRATKSEGMIPLRDIPDDFYFLEEKQYRIIGKNTRKSYRLGDPIRVMVREVNPKRKTITLRPTAEKAPRA